MRIVMLKGHAETKTTESGAEVRELYSAGCTYNVADELGARLLEGGKAYREGEDPPKPKPRPLRGSDGRRPTLIGGKRFYDHVLDDPTPAPPVQRRGEDGRRPTLVGGKRVFGSVVQAPEAGVVEGKDATVSFSADKGDTWTEQEPVEEVFRSSADAETRESDPTDEELEDEAVALESDPVDEDPNPEAPESEED